MIESDDLGEIRDLWDRGCAALCAGDFDAYSRLWAPTEYIEIIHPLTSDWRIGWDAIGPAYRALLASGFRCEVETRSMRVRLSTTHEMAWATAEVLIRQADPPAESLLWQTLVFERIRGHWRLVHGHASAPLKPS